MKPIIGLIDPNYNKHINGVLTYDDIGSSRILGSTNSVFKAVCNLQNRRNKLMHIMHRLTHKQTGWSDVERTDGSLGWIPFVSVATCSISLKNDNNVAIRFRDKDIVLNPGEFVVYDYNTMPYSEVCGGNRGSYVRLNIHYMFVPKWLPLPIFRFYKWVFENTEWLQRKLNPIYIWVLAFIGPSAIPV